MRLLRNTDDLSKATIICIGYYAYLLLDGEGFDDLHEIHTDLEEYPTDNYIYLDPEEIVPYFFSTEEIGKELDFETWEEAENYFSKKEV